MQFNPLQARKLAAYHSPKAGSLLAALVLTAVAACTGKVDSNRTEAESTSGAGNTSGGGKGSAGNCKQAGTDTGATVLRRLSNLEYQLTLQDLFQLPAAPALDGIPPDVDQQGFRTYAGIQTVNAQHLRAYIARAQALAEALMADSARRSKVLGCEPTASDCLRSFVTKFGKLAYRRPLQAAELDAIVTHATADALDATDQFKFAIEVLLSSANFLYRVEIGNAGGAVATLTPQELAARLSFALWGRGPDAKLIDEATAMVGTPDALAATTTKMLADPRAKTFYEAFFRQWLGFEGIKAPPNAPEGFTDALATDMARETQLVLGDFAWGEKRNFLDVLTASYTRSTPALSSFYKLPSPGSDGTTQFTSKDVRAGSGLLTHPSLLAARRDGDLIAIRGNWLRHTFLCSSLTLPPTVAAELGGLLAGLNHTEIVKKRNSEAACKGCHAQIDPIGIGFEQFDNAGRFDAKVNPNVYGIPAALPDAEDGRFTTIAELASKLRALPEVSACLANKVFIYAEGRDPEDADACQLESASKAFADNGNSFSAMLRGMVTSPAFRTRRAGGSK